MMYLSQIRVDRLQAARRRFTDAYCWHQAIWQAFPAPADSPRSFLFRVDEETGGFRILVLSEHRPVVPEWGSWESKAIAGNFLHHKRYRFQLRANPTIKKVADHAGKRRPNGARVGLYDEQALREWLQRKAGQAGCALKTVSVLPPTDQYFSKDGKRGKHVRVEFQGVLEVDDPEKFRSSFQSGIGSAKAFGFGLLLLEKSGSGNVPAH